MIIWTFTKKELRLLLRDRLAAAILLVLPVVFILILGLLLGEGFGQKPDDRLRVSIVDLDKGYFVDPVAFREGMAWFMAAPGPVRSDSQAAAALAFTHASQAFEHSPGLHAVRDTVAWLAVTPPTAWGAGGLAKPSAGMQAVVLGNHSPRLPPEPWSRVVQRDLAETAGIRLEIISTENDDAARSLVSERQRAAVLVFGPNFSDRVARCSFLGGPEEKRNEQGRSGEPGGEAINPFFRDGVQLDKLDVELIQDPTQATAASIIDQVAQVALLRVILPWMIGNAFEKLGDPAFIELLGKEVELPLPGPFTRKVPLHALLTMPEHKRAVGAGVQSALRHQFAKYNLTGKTWADLTMAAPTARAGAAATPYRDEAGRGFLGRGAARYQILVPSLTVMFAFFLVLSVGWLFVAERRQGTLKRTCVAPVSRGQILLGKFVPCLLLSLSQGFFLLAAGKLIFGMRWGPETWPVAEQVLWLVPVVFCTSLAAVGLALLGAALARSEIQVAVFTLVMLVVALVSGCMIPRELMSEPMQALTIVTPHAWALDAYTQLLLNPSPNLAIVGRACAVLTAFGTGFMMLAWRFVRLA